MQESLLPVQPDGERGDRKTSLADSERRVPGGESVAVEH